MIIDTILFLILYKNHMLAAVNEFTPFRYVCGVKYLNI